MKNDIGFTLIELLVVVAIISLLASIILIGIFRVQDKTKDSVIMRELSETRTVAQMILVESGVYNASGNELCDLENTLNDKNVNHLVLKEIEEKVKKYNPGETPVTCFATSNSFCVSSPLNLETGFCVDSTGQVTTKKVICDSTTICHD